MTQKANWIAVDWGTTNLRAWVLGADDEVLVELSAASGGGGLSGAEFEAALLALVESCLAPGQTIPVVACGMVGSRQGWIEAGYRAVPCRPSTGQGAVVAPTRDPRIKAFILPGLSQARPADVMRGEETQTGGFLAACPEFDGSICLPGSHSKWVQASAGEVVSFRTFLTGELYAAITAHTVLRHSVASGEDLAAFDRGVQDGLSRPEMLTTQLFALRAEGLLHGLGGASAAQRISGLLIGAELAGARHYWLGREVALVGEPGLCRLYARALEAQGVRPRIEDGRKMALEGLRTAHAAMGKGGLI